jgi:hypothetical protein
MGVYALQEQDYRPARTSISGYGSGVNFSPEIYEVEETMQFQLRFPGRHVHPVKAVSNSNELTSLRQLPKRRLNLN